jgi:hypothetical protein
MDKTLLEIIQNFESLGSDFAIGDRNKIKIIPFSGVLLNIKSFKVPNLLKGIIYKFFRPSKAKRSYEYAKILERKGIGTPKPIAFYENKNWFKLKDSYYVCHHVAADYVFRDVFTIPIEQKEYDAILHQFARFCFSLHENGIEFLDHSPGNTLIKKMATDQFSFYLVDLNRMKFHETMDFETRMKNMCRITPRQDQIEVISEEYAKCYGKSKEEVFERMWFYTSRFQEKYKKRQMIKQKLKV